MIQHASVSKINRFDQKIQRLGKFVTCGAVNLQLTYGGGFRRLAGSAFCACHNLVEDARCLQTVCISAPGLPNATRRHIVYPTARRGT
jgi:hypothetical protein